MDSKISALEHLVNVAETRIAELEALTARRERLDGTAGVGTQAERLRQSPRRESAAAPTAAAQRTSADHGGERAAQQTEVYALADAGHASPSIAALVGLPVGEVELMLGLRQAR